jgi:ATP-binding cassette subfamily B protein
MLQEEAPQPVVQGFAREGLGDGPLLLTTSSDLALGGQVERHWLLVNTDRIAVLSDEPTPRLLRNLPLSGVSKFRAHRVVGSGFLQAQVDGMWVDLLRYSNGLADRFSKIARKLERLRTDGRIEFFPQDDVDPHRCRSCGMMLRFVGDVCPQCMDRKAIRSKVWDLIRPYRAAAAGIFALLLAGVVAELVPPKLQQYLVDDILRVDHRGGPIGKLTSSLLAIVLFLACTRVVLAIVSELKGRLSLRVGTALTSNLRARMVQKLQQLSVAFYDRHQVGVLMNRVAYDTEVLHGLIHQITGGFLLQILQLLGVGAMLFTLNATLALYTLIPMPLVLAGSWFFWRYVYPRYYRYWDSASKQAGALSGMLSGIRVVKAFAQEDREFERFRASSEYLRKSRLAVELSSTTFSAVMQVIFSLGGLIVWYVGGRDVLGDRMTLGSLMAFLAYLAMFYAPLSTLAQLTTWLTSFMTACQRIFELLDTPTRITDSANPVRLPEKVGGIRFENVTFGYDRHHPVLENVSFEIPHGKMIGIVGRSGSGKSTLVNLICRFYDVDEGRVLVEERDVRELAGTELRRHVGVVLQESFLFRGTVWENLIYGNPDATPEMVIQAARAANAHDFILKMPFAYDMPLGERGAGLSGGEKQRMSIARAVLYDPSILILDEATSNLDSESEKAIQEALFALTRGRTSIVIAHRLSTLRNADRIMAFDRGKLMEEGTHEELLAKDGIYASMVKIQTRLTAGASIDKLVASAEDEGNSEESGTANASEEASPAKFDFAPRWLTPQTANIHLGTHDALHVTVIDDRIYGGVFAVRVFPAAYPDQYISLRHEGSDGREHEIGIIARLSDWPQEVQRLVQEALDRRYFIHVIERIESIRLRFGLLIFHVVTNRGPEQFMMRWQQSQAIDHGEGGKILTDVDENRYLIANVESLPKAEQDLFRRHVYW